jgi:hypothetical protein
MEREAVSKTPLPHSIRRQPRGRELSLSITVDELAEWQTMLAPN